MSQIQKTQNLSKRALKRLRDSQYEKGIHLSNGIASNKEHYLDTDVCKVALDVLQNVFFNSGTLLKQTFFKVSLPFSYFVIKLDAGYNNCFFFFFFLDCTKYCNTFAV